MAAEIPVIANETPFWTEATQMALSNAARLRLSDEGLMNIRDFDDFKLDSLNQAIKNMRTTIPPIQGIQAIVGADGVEQHPAIAPVPGVPAIVLSAKCILRLKTASKAYHYYVSIGRARTAGNMHYENVLKGFLVEWQAIEKLSKEDKPDVP